MVNQSVKALLEGHRYEGPPSEHYKGAPRTTDATKARSVEDTQDETRRAIYTSMTIRYDCGRYVCISNELRKESGELILAGPGGGLGGRSRYLGSFHEVAGGPLITVNEY